MKTKLTEKQERMAELIHEWRHIMDTCENAKIDLSAEQAARCEEINTEVGLLSESIAVMKRNEGNKMSLEHYEQEAGRPADSRNMWASGVANAAGLPYPGQMPGRVDIRSLDINQSKIV